MQQHSSSNGSLHDLENHEKDSTVTAAGATEQDWHDDEDFDVKQSDDALLDAAEVNPKSLEELKLIAENFVKGISRDTLLRVADNFCTSDKLCIQEKGGHFDYLLKKKK